MFGKNKVDVPLKGVGGWLGFLVLRYMVFMPIMLIGRTQNELADAEKQAPQLLEMASWLKYKSILWPTIWVFIAVSVYAGYGLWKVHIRQSVTTAIAAEWLLSLGIYAGTLLAMHIAFGEIPSLTPDTFGGFFGSLIMSSIWTAYLLRSRRVKNTYQ